MSAPAVGTRVVPLDASDGRHPTTGLTDATVPALPSEAPECPFAPDGEDGPAPLEDRPRGDDMRVPDEIAGEDAPRREAAEGLGAIIKRLVTGQLYGVLCTQGQGQPYGSLVAYAVTPDLAAAVFATQRATRKYRLLTECSHVALVVDSRAAFPGQLMEVEAVTATGRAVEVAAGSEFERWSRLLLDRHPNLDQFVRSASCSVFRIDVVRYFHVTRFQEVRQWVPGNPA
jgi:nitroimidazol reductase NimA-like FMN-containing flavoprotein (pyridoxamine 5'-phosphate oxidase superfamily)